MFRCFTELGTDLLARTNEENNCHIVSQKARLGLVGRWESACDQRCTQT